MPTKKKQNKSLLKKLNFHSRKTQSLTTVLVFALLGGGLLIYRGFAATVATYFNYTNRNLSYSATGGCKVLPFQDTSGKAGVWVINTNCVGAKAGSAATFSTVGGNVSAAQVGHSYQICAWLKGVGTVSLSLGQTGRGGGAPGYPVNFPNYSSYCISGLTATSTGAIGGSATVSPGSYLNVSSLELIDLGSVVSGTPAPAK